MTRDEFLDAYPAFDTADSSELVEAKLAEAATEIDEAGGAGALTTRYDAAHGFLTAHKLWISEFGVSLRLALGETNGESHYLEQYNRIWRGARAVSRVKTSTTRGW